MYVNNINYHKQAHKSCGYKQVSTGLMMMYIMLSMSQGNRR